MLTHLVKAAAHKVRLVYWKPEPESSNTSFPSAPLSAVSDDYTFVKAVCAGPGETQIGTVHDEVTRAYAPEALSTSHCYHKDWSPINYTSLYDPLPDYNVITERACSMSVSPGQSIDALFFLAGFPLLSIPQDVSLIDPLWASCTAEPFGGYDPPRVLTGAGPLIAGSAAVSSILSQAQPASSVVAPLPEETGSAPQMTSTPGKASPSRENLENSNLAASPIPAATSTKEAPNNGNAGSPRSSVDAMVPPESQANLQDPRPSISQSQAFAFPDGIVPNLPVILLSGTANSDSSETILKGPLVAFSGTADPFSSNSLDPVVRGSVPTSSQDIDHVASPASGGVLVLGTLTLSPGEQTTHAGHAVSVGSDMVVADGATYTVLSGSGGASLQLVPQPTNSGALAAVSGTAGAGMPLDTYGSASATVTGTPEASSGRASAASTSTGDGGIGGIIMSAFGGNGASISGTTTSGNASSVESFLAAAARPQRSLFPSSLLLLLSTIFTI